MPRAPVTHGRRLQLLSKYGITTVGRHQIPCYWCGREVEMTITAGRLGGPPVRVACGYHAQFDHLVPVIHGGTNALDNLVISCGQCNASRGAKHWYPPRLTKGLR